MHHGQQYQQPQQLPVSAQQLERPFLNIDVNRPPFVPQIQVDPFIAQYVPVIAGLCASEIQVQAHSNPMRVFMFNLYSLNNFANADFESLVIGCCDYVMLCISKRQFQEPGQALQTCVPRVVEMMAAMNVSVYPALQPFVPGQTVGHIQNLIGMFHGTLQEINNMKSQQAHQATYQQPPAPHVYNQPQQRQYPQPSAQYQQPQQRQQGGGTVSLFGSSGSHTPHQSARATSVAAGRWNQKVEEVSFEATPVATVAQPFRSSITAPAPVVEVQQELVPQLPEGAGPLWELLADGSLVIPVTESEYTWKPTEAQPYIPAYKPSTQMLFHQVLPDGTVGFILKELTDKMMEYSKHQRGGSSFGNIPKVEIIGRTDMAKVHEAIQNLNHADLAKEGALEDEESTVTPVMINQNWGISTSLQAAILEARMAHMQAEYDSGESIDAFESYASVLEVHADAADYNHVIARLGSVETYVGFGTKLRALKDDIPDDLWYLIDDIMTDAVHRVLHNNLSVNLDIGGFSDDINELVAIIEKRGRNISNAFLEHQEDTIRKAMTQLNDATRGLMTAQLLPPDNTQTKLTYICEDISMTLLDCMSFDLDVQLNDALAVAVLKTVVPDLYDLVKGIFDRATELENNFSRHYILTNDRKLLEVSKGHVGSDIYLLSVVD